MTIANLALRDTVRIDLTQAAPWAGAIRAAPVAALFAFGLAIGSPRTALTLAVGANLVAVVSLVGSIRVPVGVMVFDTFGLGVATFIGSATASDDVLHLLVLGVWSFAAGLLVVAGIGPATVGVQSVIAFVVFGRFVDAPLAAVELALLVSAGAAIESAALLLLRLPPTLREQRAHLSLAFRRLGEFAARRRSTAAVVAAESLDRAAQMLDRPGLFGRADARALDAMLEEGRRIRLELTAIVGLERRLVEPRTDVDRAMMSASDALGAIASAIARPADHRRSSIADDVGAIGALEAAEVGRPVDRPVVAQIVVHFEALAGQLRAAGALLEGPAKSVAGARPEREHRSLSLGRASVFVANEFALVRSGLRPDSSAFRHAVRLAVAVPASELIARALHLPRPYWVPFAVVAVLKADYSTLFRRGLGRVVGTVTGATFAALIVGGLHPGEIASVAFVGGVAWASYSLWQSNFALSTAFTTALILVLLSATQVDTLSTALDRLIDTVLGGAIALGVYVAWPTWSTTGARTSLGVLVRSIAAYLTGTIALVGGDDKLPGELGDLARSARISWGRAEAAVGRSLDEPKQHRIDSEFANGALVASRRVIQALHSLRLEAQRGVTVEPFEALQALAGAFAERLELVAGVLDGDADPTGLGPSRALRLEFAAVEAALERREAPRAIAFQLDEIVDAINTLSGVVASGGARSVDDDHLHLRWSR